MKKLCVIVASIVISGSLVSCSSMIDNNGDNGKENVVSNSDAYVKKQGQVRQDDQDKKTKPSPQLSKQTRQATTKPSKIASKALKSTSGKKGSSKAIKRPETPKNNSNTTNKPKSPEKKKVSNKKEIKKTQKEIYYGNTCGEIVKSFRPNGIGKNFPIRCVDAVDGSKGNSGNSKALGSTTIVDKNGIFTPKEIVVRNDLSPWLTRAVITHETYHAMSFHWSPKKQEAFLRSLGANDWLEGSYVSQPAEMWANTATVCAGYDFRKSYHKLPGGCDTVRKWVDK